MELHLSRKGQDESSGISKLLIIAAIIAVGLIIYIGVQLVSKLLK